MAAMAEPDAAGRTGGAPADGAAEELASLARAYHRLQDEHGLAGTRGGERMRVAAELFAVRKRFERVLADGVADEELRRAWSRHLHHRTGEPGLPAGPSETSPAR